MIPDHPLPAPGNPGSPEETVMITIRADNPSPLTGPGTNSFLVGPGRAAGGGLALIDPGPDLPAHRAAILDAAEGRIEAILITHPHMDHSGGAAAIAAATGAPVIGFGDIMAGRSAMIQGLGDIDELGGGEGLDHLFSPDRTLRDGEQIAGSGWSLTALHLPGHSAGHLGFADEARGQIFTGDLVFDWSTTLISPPDGDLADYMRSLSRLEAMGSGRLIPAHGAQITAPRERLRELAAHRRMRTAQILAALATAPDTAQGLARRIYDLPPDFLPVATRNVLAHLLALLELGAVRHEAPLTVTTTFFRE